MVKLSRCPLTSQEHDSPTAVRRGERSKEGKRDSERREASEESWRRNVVALMLARFVRGGAGGHSAVNSSGKRGTILHTGTVGRLLLSRDGTRCGGGTQRPEQSICLAVFAQGCCTPLKEGIPAVFPLCLSRLRFSCTPFHGEIGRAGRGGGSLDHCHSPSSLPPLHFSSSKLDKCAPLIILAIDLFPSKQQPPRDSSTLKIEFFLIMVPNETGITRLPSPLFPLPAFQETRCSLPRYQAAALEDR